MVKNLERVGLTDGPTFAAMGSAPDCLMQRASFQLVVGSPYLFDEAETLFGPGIIGSELCVRAETGMWPGDAGVRWTIGSGNTAFEGTLTVTPLQPGETNCDLRPPLFVASIDLPANRTLVYDSVLHTIYEVETSSQRTVGTVEHITFPSATGDPGPVRWLDLGPCANVCMCLLPAAFAPNNQVHVELVGRSL